MCIYFHAFESLPTQIITKIFCFSTYLIFSISMDNLWYIHLMDYSLVNPNKCMRKVLYKCFTKESVQMTNKYMKNVLTFVIGNMQIKAIINYRHIPSKTFMLKKKCQMLVRMWNNWNRHTMLVPRQNGSSLECYLLVSTKPKHMS